MRKPSVSKTLGPIHFEDLDPHRFEDLVRELIYDFKDWQTIEATGRSGQDGGFDARAFERINVGQVEESADEEDLGVAPMDGNLWMIQAKREKTLGPARIKAILKDVNSDTPPYGYILAAAADISKKSYDTFREELRKKGVTEFYLWSKAELEDMLHQPKNDRILFTFFGISLVSKRRSRATEIRQVVSTKNRLIRALGEDVGGQKSILVRDVDDTRYPYSDKYPDFESRPRWKEYIVKAQHPTGIIVKLTENFAFVDLAAKEFDFAEECNLTRTESDHSAHDPEWYELRSRTEQQWEHLPLHAQAVFHRNGLIRYEDIVVVDDKGDALHGIPHLFAIYDRSNGLIAGSHAYLTIGDSVIALDEFKRVRKWPESAEPPALGEIHGEGSIALSDGALQELQHSTPGVLTLYDFDGRYSNLKLGDFVMLKKAPGSDTSQHYLEITHTEKLTVEEYLTRRHDHAWRMERAIGRKPAPDELVTIYEGKRRYDFEVERRKTSGQIL